MVTLLASLAHAGGGFYTNFPDVQWHTLETEHFFFHWPESTRPEDDEHYFTTEFTASHLAQIAEESYPKITDQFAYDLKEKVHVVIYDQNTDWAGNGFALAEWDWTGFAADWGPVYRQRGRMEFLTDVFVHEFAHIVSLKAYLPWSEGTTGFQIGGLVEDEEWLQRWGVQARPHTNFDVGFNWMMSAHAPFWWAEGGAEYWSHRAGYNWWGTSREAFIRVAWREDRVLTLDEWTTRIDKKGFDSERGYNGGYAFGLWLYGQYGSDWMTHMAATSAERMHLSWEAVVEETTGKKLENIYSQWTAHLDAYFGQISDEVAERGLVEGRELSLTELPWEFPDEDWEKLDAEEKGREMDGETAYIELPSISPDGEVMAWFDRGLNIRKIRADQWGTISGEYLDEEEDEDQIEAFGDLTYGNDWFLYSRPSWSPDGRILALAPEDYSDAWNVDPGLTFNADGYDWPQLFIGTLTEETKRKKTTLDVSWTPIPGTLRAAEAAWSPDGETIAFAKYGNGTHELYTIKPDGSERTKLSDFDDGAQIQGISWNPEGTHVLVALFRDFQQDMWTFEVATGTWTRLTDTTSVDEVDPWWGPDGRIWFSSDRDGIYNVYTMDPESGAVEKQTETLGSSYGAVASPEGHLFYTNFTGHGFRVMGVNAADLKHEAVDYPGSCLQGAACAPMEEATDLRAAIPSASELSNLYRPSKALMPLSGWPVLRTTDKNVEVGTGFYAGDFAETHYLEGEVTVGKDNYFYLSYWLDTLWPSVMLGYMRYQYKGTYGYAVDEDYVLETTDDVTVVDLKFEQASDDIWAYVTYTPSYSLWGGVGADASRYSFRDAGDGADFVPFTVHWGVGAFGEWWPSDWWSEEGWINTRKGRRVYLDYQYRHTNVIDPEYGGATYDDGQLLDAYNYHQVNASWTEYVPVGWFGKAKEHTLQLDFELGYIDKNVMSWDEFLAGGRHPYHWGSGTFGNNVQFSGYEGWSLSGETMLIGNASYRFPIKKDMNLRTGPVYTEAVYGQIFTTAGNLWSYRIDGPSHIEGYYVVADDPSDIRREVPFVDYAYKNSPADSPNYLLNDIGAELRIRSYIWNDWDWDSFVRVAYGLDEVAGWGDVNADYVSGSLARDEYSELSDEVEPPTLRVYVGIGTGW